MRLDIIFCLFFFPACIVSPIGDATGTNFLDSFVFFDRSLWRRNDKTLYCSNECVLTNGDYVENVHSPQMSKNIDRFELQLLMRNDCSGPECCHGDKCANFRAGQIHSNHSYAYGTFSFAMRAAKTQRGRFGATQEAWSCFALNRMGINHKAITEMGVSLCIPSQQSKTAVVRWRYGENFKEKTIDLRKDAGDESVLFKIDWFPDWIVIRIDNDPVLIVDGSINMIPDDAMYIRVMLTPQESTNPKTGRMGNFIAHRMHVEEIGYTKYVPGDENMLLYSSTSTNSSHFSGVFLILILALGLMVLFASLFLLWKWRKRSNSPAVEGYTQLPERRMKYEAPTQLLQVPPTNGLPELGGGVFPISPMFVPMKQTSAHIPPCTFMLEGEME